MKKRYRTRSRLAVSSLVVVGAVVLLASPAWAHVEVDPGSAPKGATQAFSFRVPNEEPTVVTVKLDVQFPTDHPFAHVLVQAKPGWTFTTETETLSKPIKTDDGSVTTAVTRVTWTATAGGIPPGAYDLFPVLAGLPTDTAKLTFKAIQTYSNGEVVSWIETPVKGAPEPEHPAPVLKLTRARKSG